MLNNDVFVFIASMASDIATLARSTVFTAFGLPVSLWEVWLSLFVLSALFAVVFVSKSYNVSSSENLAMSEFDTFTRSVRPGGGRRGSSYGSSVSERTITGDSTRSTNSSGRRSSTNVTIRF